MMNEGTKPTPEFEAWAKSFSGCDGGDLNAPIWFCGIENGANKADLEKKTQKSKEAFFKEWNDSVLKWKDQGSPEGLSDGNREFFFTKNPYDEKVIKLHAAIFNHDKSEKYKRDGHFDFQSYAKDFKAYAKLSINDANRNRSIFKLNLFPLAFNSADPKHWGATDFECTNLKCKKDYIDWCVNNRFPEIREWVGKYKPKVIICTGKGHKNNFANAFLGKDAPKEVDIDWNSDKTKKLIMYKPSSEKTPVLIITPFLGFWRYCLNSDDNVFDVGLKIREVLDENEIFPETFFK